MRKSMIAGNWKMNGALALLEDVFKALDDEAKGREDREAVVCPPFTLLRAAADRASQGGGAVMVGGQDLYWEGHGAHTGEISAAMLLEAGCRCAIVGHSERRARFGETDETVARKLAAVLKAGLIPIVCVGETLEERERGRMEAVLDRQVREGILPLAGEEGFDRLVVAYEPVWAIGTGRTASDDQANEAAGLVRGIVSERTGAEFAEGRLRVLYGGSVTAENVDGLMAQPHIDGALVGGASLKPDQFRRIFAFQ